MFHRHVAGLPHGVQLEQRIEVHKLDTRDVIDFTWLGDVTQIVIHRLEGVRVAIGHRITQYGIILAYEYEIDAPRVDAN